MMGGTAGARIGITAAPPSTSRDGSAPLPTPGGAGDEYGGACSREYRLRERIDTLTDRVDTLAASLDKTALALAKQRQRNERLQKRLKRTEQKLEHARWLSHLRSEIAAYHDAKVRKRRRQAKTT